MEQIQKQKQMEEILQTYGGYIYQFALKLSAHPQDAQDLSAQTFLQAWKHLDELKNPAGIQSWLRTICFNEFKMILRKQKNVSFDFSKEVEELECESRAYHSIAPSIIDELHVCDEVKKLRDGCFLAMSRRLTLPQRMAFSMIDMFGLSIDEVAYFMDITPTAVKGLLHRARKNLTAFFQDHCSILDVDNPCQCSAWMEFMKQRDQFQEKMKQHQEPLDYQEQNIQIREHAMQQMLYYYQHMPQAQPEEQLYNQMIEIIQTLST